MEHYPPWSQLKAAREGESRECPSLIDMRQIGPPALASLQTIPMQFKASNWGDEEKVARATARVQSRIQKMIDEGLTKRQSIFFG